MSCQRSTKDGGVRTLTFLDVTGTFQAIANCQGSAQCKCWKGKLCGVYLRPRWWWTSRSETGVSWMVPSRASPLYAPWCPGFAARANPNSGSWLVTQRWLWQSLGPGLLTKLSTLWQEEMVAAQRYFVYVRIGWFHAEDDQCVCSFQGPFASHSYFKITIQYKPRVNMLQHYA